MADCRSPQTLDPQLLFTVLRVVGKTLQTLSGSTTSMAALSDCASGDRLTFWSAWLGSAACVGVIIGGWIETAILALRGQGKDAPSFCAIFTFKTLVWNHLYLYKTIILPRQAPDKHRESTQKRDVRFP